MESQIMEVRILLLRSNNVGSNRMSLQEAGVAFHKESIQGKDFDISQDRVCYKEHSLIEAWLRVAFQCNVVDALNCPKPLILRKHW